MRLSRCLGLGMLLLAVSACGSKSYPDSVHSALTDMADILAVYNRSSMPNPTAAAAACRRAHDKLSGDSDLASTSPPDQYKRLGAALAQAYRSAIAGFADCSVGDYPHMAQADAELARANDWIAQARALDH